MITFSLGQMSAMVVFEGALSGQMFEGRGGGKMPTFVGRRSINRY